MARHLLFPTGSTRALPARNSLTAILLSVLTLGVVGWPQHGMAQQAGGLAWYLVRHGDNLTYIARRFGCTVSALKQENGLNSDLIRPRQRLTIPHPFQRTDPKSITWRCPLTRPGRVLHDFGPQKNAQGVTIPHTGVDLAAKLGAQIYSPAIGVIRYVGHQDGYGTIIIIQHGGRTTSVLAPLDPESARVAVGQGVLTGDLLGRVGQPVELPEPYLHVELRQAGKAVAPDRLQK